SISAGNTRKVPPPATALMALAIAESPKYNTISGKFIAFWAITWQKTYSIYSSASVNGPSKKMTTGKIAIASDNAGFELKETLKKDIAALGYDVTDLGPAGTQSVDYPDFASKLADWMKTQPVAKGVLICGSGIGMSIAANRHKHIRAALAHD